MIGVGDCAAWFRSDEASECGYRVQRSNPIDFWLLQYINVIATRRGAGERVRRTSAPARVGGAPREALLP